jgi:hypothetical protein
MGTIQKYKTKTNMLNEEDQNSVADNSLEGDIGPANLDPKLAMAGNLIDEATGMLQQALRLLGQVSGGTFSSSHQVAEDDDGEARVIEGVFDGQRMIGPDGRHYSVPANYSSKSKLVEGDLLKLTITAKGAFVYKQVGPIARRRLLGKLKLGNGLSEWVVDVEGHKYRILTASVTYYKGREGDEATILVPESGQSTWAAVENIIKSGQSSSDIASIDSASVSDDLV